MQTHPRKHQSVREKGMIFSDSQAFWRRQEKHLYWSPSVESAGERQAFLNRLFLLNS